MKMNSLPLGGGKLGISVHIQSWAVQFVALAEPEAYRAVQ
jgi:hypothetical protein